MQWPDEILRDLAQRLDARARRCGQPSRATCRAKAQRLTISATVSPALTICSPRVCGRGLAEFARSLDAELHATCDETIHEEIALDARAHKRRTAERVDAGLEGSWPRRS